MIVSAVSTIVLILFSRYMHGRPNFDGDMNIFRMPEVYNFKISFCACAGTFSEWGKLRTPHRLVHVFVIL